MTIKGSRTIIIIIIIIIIEAVTLTYTIKYEMIITDSITNVLLLTGAITITCTITSRDVLMITDSPLDN